jgi:ArsR family transcriptional regulator
MPMRERVIQEAAALFAAMGHPTRLRILAVLQQREHDVSELCAELGLAAPNVSQHLGLLRAHHLVTVRREGTHMRYALRGARVGELLSRALDLLAEDVPSARDVQKAIRLVRQGRL